MARAYLGSKETILQARRHSQVFGVERSCKFTMFYDLWFFGLGRFV